MNLSACSGELTRLISKVSTASRISEIGVAELTLCREWNDYFNRTIMPTIRVPDFNMSTVSQAS